MGRNQVGGQPCDMDEEWYYYERLPVNWRRWIRELEFDVSSKDVWLRWQAGYSLEQAAWDYKVFFTRFKRELS